MNESLIVNIKESGRHGLAGNAVLDIFRGERTFCNLHPTRADGSRGRGINFEAHSIETCNDVMVIRSTNTEWRFDILARGGSAS